MLQAAGVGDGGGGRGGREEQRVGGGEAEGVSVVDDDRGHLYLRGTSVESAGRGVRSGRRGGGGGLTYAYAGRGGGGVWMCLGRMMESLRLCV